MRQSQIKISEESHRNPSRSKLNRNNSKNMSRESMKKSEQSLPKKQMRTPSVPSVKQTKFLHKCFEQVYLQNLALNQEVARKKKQYAYVVFQYERIRKLNGSDAHKKQAEPSRFTQQVSGGYKYQGYQNQINKQMLYKPSLSSIQSVDAGDSSLMSERFVPVEDDNKQISDENKQISNENKQISDEKKERGDENASKQKKSKQGMGSAQQHQSQDQLAKKYLQGLKQSLDNLNFEKVQIK